MSKDRTQDIAALARLLGYCIDEAKSLELKDAIEPLNSALDAALLSSDEAIAEQSGKNLG